MALCLGLTGGIGAGKSTVAKIFQSLQVPVFFADDVAKDCYNEKLIQLQVAKTFGEDLFINGQLQTQLLGPRVFGNSEELKKLEAIIHPRVHEHWLTFAEFHQKEKYVIRENAILIQSEGHLTCDKIAVVTAPLEVKIKRVMQRSHLSREQIERRIQHQWSDDRLIAFADWVITNDNQHSILTQVMEIHESLMQ